MPNYFPFSLYLNKIPEVFLFLDRSRVNAVLLEGDDAVNIIIKQATFNGTYSYKLLEQWPNSETLVTACFTIENIEPFGAEGYIVEITSQEEYIVSEDPKIHENFGTKVVTAAWICPGVEDIDKD